MPIFTFLISDLPRGLWTKAFLWKNSQIKLEKMTLVSVFQVSNFLSYSHYKIKGTYEKKNWFRPGGHCHMNSQIMENVIQYYLHVYDNARRIYSQNKSEYRTANYLYWGSRTALSVCVCLSKLKDFPRRISQWQVFETNNKTNNNK